MSDEMKTETEEMHYPYVVRGATMYCSCGTHTRKLDMPAYENIRIDTTDISKIAQNTGMPEWKISRIKDHVFSNEHILDAGVKRFDADPEIADAWYRLTNGTYNQNDIDLLNHEYFESKFESFYKTDYRTAHNKTEESGRIWDPYKENN